jgi:hypothetical protein
MKRNLFLLVVIITVMQNATSAQFRIMPGASLTTTNGGHVVLNNINLINNGSIQQAVNSGVFDFRGNGNDSIFGTGIAVFDRINLSKTPGAQLVLQRDISVNSEFIFTTGMLYLDNYVLDLAGLGALTNETENNRAFTFGTGYLQATQILNSPSSVNMGNLGVIITSTKNLGNTVIRRGHQVQPNIYGSNNSIQRYFDITATNNISLKATLTFNYFDAELNGLDEATITLWKKKDPVLWDYVGHDTRDATANYFLRNNISKFSRWTLAFDTASTIVRASHNIKIKEIVFDNHFIIRAFPNPSNSSFNLTIQSRDQIEKIQVKVLTITGQVIETRNINPGELLKIGDKYRPGTYLVEAIQGNQRKTIKVIKLSD